MNPEFATALAKAQAEMSNAGLDKTNPHFKSKYASLPEIRSAVLPALNKHGFAVIQTTRYADGVLLLVTKLIHAAGEIEGEYPVTVGKPQETGSALTYARRYTLAAIAVIGAGDDDDGDTKPKRTGGNFSYRDEPAKPATRPEPAVDLRQAGADAASEGTAALQAWFAGLSKADKVALKPYLDETLKHIAKMADDGAEDNGGCSDE